MAEILSMFTSRGSEQGTEIMELFIQRFLAQPQEILF
jgi:hypothetical protein